MITIGQLAKQTNLRTSALRYYEREGLLQPDERTEAGYRLYRTTAVQKIQLIQRAQRAGFSLDDIRTFMNSMATGQLSNQALLQTAEARFLDLERQITERLVLRHELKHFLQDLYHHEHDQHTSLDNPFNELIDRVCAHHDQPLSSDVALDRIIQSRACHLSSVEGQALVELLRGEHMHIWQEADRYQILVVSQNEEVGAALQKLALLEEDCQIHAQLRPQVVHDQDGFLLTVSGEFGFLLVRLFLALEHEHDSHSAASL